MLLSGLTTLVLATARITNPNVTHEEFNRWYNTVYLPDFMTDHNASLALRYKPAPGASSSWEYLALYKTHQAIETTSIKVPASDDIGPEDVAIELSSWTPIQTFESLREKRGDTPKGRPVIATVVKIEPRKGGEEELEEWYQKQHLDMLSMTTQYRRSTRYRSSDGSSPRWLAIHEQDSTAMDAYAGDVLMNTELTKSVMNGIRTFQPMHWEFIFEAGDVTEKL